MPLRTVKEADGALEAQLPGTLQRVSLGDLHPDLDSANRYFRALVLLNYPVTKLGNGETLFKAVLEEPVKDQSCSKVTTINTFFFGKLAEECSKCIHQGDILAITGFKCAKSPSGNKDGRHYCQLEVHEENTATVYVYAKSQPTSSVQAESSVSKQKQFYVPLDKLKGGTTVNVYGVVKFFKPPYRSKGTDYCSLVTIVDQSDVKLTCMIFSGNPDSLPKIFKVGDIVRFHRIRIQKFNNEMQGISNAGFSSLTFDGTPGAPLVPRTSSKTFSFSKEDQKAVEALRSWSSSHNSIPGSSVMLSTVRPLTFFDITCQLVGKAEVDSSSFLLKVWDGTKCMYPYIKLCVENDALEGDKDLIHQLRNLTVDILVFDNHAHVAKSLTVGSYLRIHNLHAKTQAPNNDDKAKTPCLELQLHGGTGYGRGITVLPESDYDVKELRRRLESVDLQELQVLNEISSLEFDGTFTELSNQEFVISSSLARCLQTSTSDQESFPTAALERCLQSSATVLTAHQHMKTTPLKIIVNSKAPQKYRIRAKLKSFEPDLLIQSVKLHCPNCNSLQEVPNKDDLNVILRNATANGLNPSLRNTALYHSSIWSTANQEGREIAIHFVKKDNWQNPQETLIMVEGGSLEEIYKLSGHFASVIPVISGEEHLFLPDASLPFLVKGNQFYYGCKQCSNPKSLEALHDLPQKDSWEPALIANVLGIVPLQYVMIMKFTFVDGTGQLDAYLWQHSEQFFQIQISEILVNEAIQKNLCKVMNTLCPARTPPKDNPWLECCIKSYNIKDGMKSRVCYQIFDTVVAEEAT